MYCNGSHCSLTMMQDIKFIHCQLKNINKHYILLDQLRGQWHQWIMCWKCEKSYSFHLSYKNGWLLTLWYFTDFHSIQFLSFLHVYSFFTHIPSVIYLGCILSQISSLVFVYDLFRPVLAGAQVYNQSSPGCQFYKRGWRWLPALGLGDLDSWWRNWRVTRCRVGPAGAGPSTGVSWSWLEDKVRAEQIIVNFSDPSRYILGKGGIYWAVRKHNAFFQLQYVSKNTNLFVMFFFF